MYADDLREAVLKGFFMTMTVPRRSTVPRQTTIRQ